MKTRIESTAGAERIAATDELKLHFWAHTQLSGVDDMPSPGRNESIEVTHPDRI
jgi:hypothetical protein